MPKMRQCLQTAMIFVLICILTQGMPASMDRFDELRGLAEKGDVVSQWSLGNKLLQTNNEADHREAIKWLKSALSSANETWRHAADEGDGNAMFELGYVYLMVATTGTLSESDALRVRGQALIREASMLGIPEAMFHQAVYFESDPAKRMELLTRSARRGNAHAIDAIADHYQNRKAYYEAYVWRYVSFLRQARLGHFELGHEGGPGYAEARIMLLLKYDDVNEGLDILLKADREAIAIMAAIDKRL